MPGCSGNPDLRRSFGMTPMPATIKEIDGNWGPGNEGLAYRVVMSMIGRGALQDGDRFWMSDDVMAEGIAIAEKEIAEWKKYLEYLQKQRSALAARCLPPKNQAP